MPSFVKIKKTHAKEQKQTVLTKSNPMSERSERASGVKMFGKQLLKKKTWQLLPKQTGRSTTARNLGTSRNSSIPNFT